MFSAKLFLVAVLLVGASARHIQWELEPDQTHEEYIHPQYYVDHNNPQYYVNHDLEYQHPEYLASSRVRRQAQGSLSLNGDGSAGLGAKVPLVGNDKNVLSAIGKVDLDNQMHTASKGFGLALDNVNGHGVSVIKESVPGFGSRLTGAGHATLFHNDKHNVGANAFVTRNMPTNYPGVPNFNTVGGGVDYTFNNKMGASLGMANTPFLGRKDYTAMGNLNVFRSPSSTVDFSAGFKRFDTPIMSSGWKPNFMLNFGRSF